MIFLIGIYTFPLAPSTSSVPQTFYPFFSLFSFVYISPTLFFLPFSFYVSYNVLIHYVMYIYACTHKIYKYIYTIIYMHIYIYIYHMFGSLAPSPSSLTLFISVSVSVSPHPLSPQVSVSLSQCAELSRCLYTYHISSLSPRYFFHSHNDA